MNNYPQSIIEKVKYQEKVIANLKETIELLENRAAIDKACLERINQRLDCSEFLRTWFWQGDGYDCTRSMVSDLPILISAGQLRQLLKDGEFIAED